MFYFGAFGSVLVRRARLLHVCGLPKLGVQISRLPFLHTVRAEFVEALCIAEPFDELRANGKRGEFCAVPQTDCFEETSALSEGQGEGPVPNQKNASCLLSPITCSNSKPSAASTGSATGFTCLLT